MTGVRAGSQGTGVAAGSQGSGVVPAPSGTPLEPILAVDGFSQTLGSQTFALPAEAVDGTWVIFFYSTSGTNTIPDLGGGWSQIALSQRVAAWYKQISGDTATPATGASNGYPHWGFLVFDQPITVTQGFAGISNGSLPQPANLIVVPSATYDVATKTAVTAGQSVYAWTHATNDVTHTPYAPATIVLSEYTTFGSDSGSHLIRQDGEGVDITIRYDGIASTAALSFVLEAA